MMAKTKEQTTQPALHGVRLPGFDLRLHRGLRAVAARQGISVRKLYEQIARAYLATVGERVEG
jgi:hypothetical protein